MSVKKKSVDHKTIAKSQDHEIRYVCSVWYDKEGKRLSSKVLKDILKKVGKSRRAVNNVLKYLGYHFDPRKKK